MHRIKFARWGLLLLLTGCSTTGKNSGEHSDGQDLDVAMKPSSKAVVGAVALPDENNHDPRTTVRPSGDAVMEWQKFFKPPPSVDQRDLLESRIKTWTNSKSPEDLVKRGQNEVALGRFAAAEVSFREALRLKGENLDALLELSALYLRKKDMRKSFELLAQLRTELGFRHDVPPDFVFRYRYTLALAYLGRGDRDKGHKVLSDLIGLDKSFTPGYAALASSYLAMSRDGVAEFVAKRGIDRGREDASLCNILGVIAERRQDYGAARNWYTRALELTPTFSPALVNRANLAIREQELGAAEEDLLRALLYTPTNVDALVDLGIVQRRTGRFESARATFTKAIEIEPDSAIARFNLAVLMVSDLKKPAVALRLFNEVLQTATITPEIKESTRGYLSDLRAGTEIY